MNQTGFVHPIHLHTEKHYYLLFLHAQPDGSSKLAPLMNSSATVSEINPVSLSLSPQISYLLCEARAVPKITKSTLSLSLSYTCTPTLSLESSLTNQTQTKTKNKRIFTQEKTNPPSSFRP